MTTLLSEIDPPQRLLMGPGPVNAHPRVLRAMSAQLLGQFDPEFTAYMNETMAAYRQVFATKNQWTLLIDGTARAAIEAAMVSLLEPGDTVVISSAGRFGGLLTEIAERCDATPIIVSAPWGEVVQPAAIAAAIAQHRPRLFACVHGDTSTTMAQPMDGIAEACRAAGSLFYVDATATLGGMAVPVDAWGADIVTGGLQKCLGGPSGVAPITINERAAERIFHRRHIELGLKGTGGAAGNGRRIASNYFDLAMILDYWSDKRLNHHTESTTLLYGARECARLVLEEGLDNRFRRHALAGAAVVAGIEAMGLLVFGDKAHKMANVTGISIPEGVDGEAVRTRMREDFGIEIGSSFGPLHGKIWRIGAMGYNATKPNVLTTLGALEAVLRGAGAKVASGAAVDAALAVYRGRGLMDSHYPRDLIGYAGRPPKANWPGGARIAVQFVLNYEEGGENSVLHGDEGAEAFLSDMVGAAAVTGARNMAMESLYEYGSRAGFWRLHRLFVERELPLTVFAVASAMQRNPHAVEAMMKADWEIASHGYRWINYQNVPPEVERRHIAAAIEIQRELTGERPHGWYQGRTSPHTAALVVEEGGFTYDADSYADDLPYYDTRHGRPQLIVPYTLDANDMKFVALNGFTTGDQFFSYLKDAFDVLYAEGGETPAMMSVGLHCRIVGKPPRLAGLKKFLDYVMGHDKVWVARRIDIARHWLAEHPHTDQPR